VPGFFGPPLPPGDSTHSCRLTSCEGAVAVLGSMGAWQRCPSPFAMCVCGVDPALRRILSFFITFLESAMYANEVESFALYSC